MNSTHNTNRESITTNQSFMAGSMVLETPQNSIFKDAANVRL
jgi:hypothetical protein